MSHIVRVRERRTRPPVLPGSISRPIQRVVNTNLIHAHNRIGADSVCSWAGSDETANIVKKTRFQIGAQVRDSHQWHVRLPAPMRRCGPDDGSDEPRRCDSSSPFPMAAMPVRIIRICGSGSVEGSTCATDPTLAHEASPAIGVVTSTTVKHTPVVPKNGVAFAETM
jgi:hypothetical protein